MRGSSRRTLAKAVISLGVSAITVGSFGLARHWGGTTAPSGSTAARSGSEKPAAFLASFVRALRSKDAAFLYDRLDPVVIARYGAPACRSAVPGLFDSTVALKLTSVNGPSTFTYASDGKSVRVPDVYTFDVTGVVFGQAATRHYHLALLDGRFHTFLDCGTPLPGAP